MLKSALTGVLGARLRFRLRLWMLRIRLTALATDSTVELLVDPTVRIGKRVRVSPTRGSRSRLEIGARTRLRDDVLLQLDGGSIKLGPDVELREGCRLNVAGSLHLEGSNVLSWGTTIHCRERVFMGRLTCCSEYVTIADSRHFHTSADTWFYANTESRPLEIGRNVWLAPKSTVVMGARVGDDCLVAANSVVSRPVEPGTVVAGTPARPVRSSLRTQVGAAATAISSQESG
ncbi:MAG TPA: acyltransferase [Candidatus Dormibacteraeota bacterium]|nr:acyltransferase [Candidatus Dormibacteraeota bacterium]